MWDFDKTIVAEGVDQSSHHRRGVLALACSWCTLFKTSALFVVVITAVVAFTALFFREPRTTRCIPPANPSRLAGCTCYLDDSYSLADCPAWNLADPRTKDNTCACDIVYISIIKPYTDVKHANTCDLWWDPSKPDYDPHYFTKAIELGKKYGKQVWGMSLFTLYFLLFEPRQFCSGHSNKMDLVNFVMVNILYLTATIAMTPYKWGEIPPWDNVRGCLAKAAEVGLVMEGLYVNFEWKGCNSDGPDCDGGVNKSACITPAEYPGFCDSTETGSCLSPGGWQDLGVKHIRTSIGETAHAPFVLHTCTEE